MNSSAGSVGPSKRSTFAFRVTGGTERLTDEVAELRAFPLDALPDVRADQRGLIERHAAAAASWARSR